MSRLTARARRECHRPPPPPQLQVLFASPSLFPPLFRLSSALLSSPKSIIETGGGRGRQRRLHWRRREDRPRSLAPSLGRSQTGCLQSPSPFHQFYPDPFSPPSSLLPTSVCFFPVTGGAIEYRVSALTVALALTPSVTCSPALRPTDGGRPLDLTASYSTHSPRCLLVFSVDVGVIVV